MWKCENPPFLTSTKEVWNSYSATYKRLMYVTCSRKSHKYIYKGKKTYVNSCFYHELEAKKIYAIIFLWWKEKKNSIKAGTTEKVHDKYIYIEIYIIYINVENVA